MQMLKLWRIKPMIKKVKVTLLVEVDTEEMEERCPSGNLLEENCVLNMVDEFLDPVKVLNVSYLED